MPSVLPRLRFAAVKCNPRKQHLLQALGTGQDFSNPLPLLLRPAVFPYAFNFHAVSCVDASEVPSDNVSHQFLRSWVVEIDGHFFLALDLRISREGSSFDDPWPQGIFDPCDCL